MQGISLFRGWWVVASCHLILLLIFGSAYSFAAFFNAWQEEFSANRAEISSILSLALALSFVIGLPAGMIADRFSYRGVVCAGIIFLSAGLYFASGAESLHSLYWVYGLGVGLGVGFAYVPAISAVQPWFIKKRGLAAGLASAGIGLGTLLIPIFTTQAMSLYGWRSTLEWVSLVILILGLIAVYFLHNSPSSFGLYPDNEPPKVGDTPAPIGLSLKEALSTSCFRWWFCAALCACFTQFIPFAHLARHALDRGLSDLQGAILLGLIGIGSISGRWALSSLADRWGSLALLKVSYVSMGISFAWWWVSLWLPPSFISLAVFAFAFGMSYGGFVGVSPPLAMGYFGARHLSSIIGALYLAAAVGALFAPTLAGYIYDQMGSYAWAISLGVVGNALALFFANQMPKMGMQGVGDNLKRGEENGE